MLHNACMEIPFDYTFDPFKEELDGVPRSHFASYCAVRREVFCDEQGVLRKDEFDSYDPTSIHLALFFRNEVAAVCRLRIATPYMKLERVATAKKHRGYGLGRTLTQFAIELASKRPEFIIVAHAQTSVLRFYEKIGFLAVSGEFLDEVSIQHRTIFFPPRKNMIRGLYIWDEPKDDEHHEFKGDAFDPEVLERIRGVLKKIESLSFVPLSSIAMRLRTRNVPLSVLPLLSDVATRIQSLQPKPIDLDGYTPFVPESRKIKAVDMDEWLANFAWEELNTGNYEQVASDWREFFAVIYLALGIKELAAGKLKTSLDRLDHALTMGYDLPCQTIASVAANVSERLANDCQADFDAANLPNWTCDPTTFSESRAIVQVEAPVDPVDFLNDYVIGDMPVLIKGATKHWKACEKWSFEYFRKCHGARTVPVELGTKYTEDTWGQKFMTIGEFLDKAPTAERRMYLAQHRLFAQIPSLLEDFDIPDLATAGGSAESEVDLHFWMGLADTISPLHTDPKHNIFCQVHGSKFVRLVSPAFKDKVKPIGGILTNTSELDAEHLPDEIYCRDATVEAGDVLFIPKEWWHYVRAKTPSISVSCWFED